MDIAIHATPSTIAALTEHGVLTIWGNSGGIDTALTRAITTYGAEHRFIHDQSNHPTPPLKLLARLEATTLLLAPREPSHPLLAQVVRSTEGAAAPDGELVCRRIALADKQDAAKSLEECMSCGGQIDPVTSECRCSA